MLYGFISFGSGKNNSVLLKSSDVFVQVRVGYSESIAIVTKRAHRFFFEQGTAQESSAYRMHDHIEETHSPTSIQNFGFEIKIKNPQCIHWGLESNM